jgi:hypothetical protein
MVLNAMVFSNQLQPGWREIAKQHNLLDMDQASNEAKKRNPAWQYSLAVRSGAMTEYVIFAVMLVAVIGFAWLWLIEQRRKRKM